MITTQGRPTQTWFITGANRGLGLGIALAALEAGHNVIATARKPEQVAQALQGYGDRLLAPPLDVSDASSVKSAVDAGLKRFGHIDVLVNNAGYGQLGAFEQLSDDAIHKQFATNVFGAFSVTRAVLPCMRARRAGHIFTISSIAGLIGFEGSSIYCAAKFAVYGWSEALTHELAQFGIKATSVEPGYFRTDFLDESSVRHDEISIPDYAPSEARRKARLSGANHQQAGDPKKFGKAIVELAAMGEPPAHFSAGADAYDVAITRAARDHGEAQKLKHLSESTDIVGK
jgi:NAD(P)-dependent dehydrogenase (short-subunit alcohol dehydrogenase family)